MNNQNMQDLIQQLLVPQEVTTASVNGAAQIVADLPYIMRTQPATITG